MEPITIVPVVYVLELEDDKVYVGITTSLNTRLAQHWTGIGSQWTRLYKPVKILEVHYDCRTSDEKRITLEWMKKKGYEKVRGAGWTKPLMNSAPKELEV